MGREPGGIRPTSTEHRCRGFVTDHDAPRSTPLDEVMRAFDVRSTDVVRVAGRIAREEGLEKRASDRTPAGRFRGSCFAKSDGIWPGT